MVIKNLGLFGPVWIFCDLVTLLFSCGVDFTTFCDLCTVFACLGLGLDVATVFKCSCFDQLRPA